MTTELIIKIKVAYDNHKLTESNINEWTSQNNLNVTDVKEILNDYIMVEYKDHIAKLKTMWSRLNSSEQSAVEHAINDIENEKADISDENIIESYASTSCRYISDGNAEPEYEDEDFYEEEPDKRAVVNYLKYKYHIID